MDRLLRKARLAHTKRTGHKRVMVGLNFVSCRDCHAQAVLDPATGVRLYCGNRIIKPEEF